MPRSPFEDLVRQHAKQKTDEQSVDWEERKNWWQGKMSALLDDIESWLAPLIYDHTIAFTRQRVQCREETLGAYQIESGLIKLGNDTLSLNPVGSVIVGGFGRVDVKGPNGSVLFLLCAPDPDVPTEKSPRQRKMVLRASAATHKIAATCKGRLRKSIFRSLRRLFLIKCFSIIRNR